MTTKEQREIIEAYERGEEIEWKSKHCNAKGFVIPNCNYQFDFASNYYRIKPERWRAEKGEEYYHITYDLKVLGEYESFSQLDDRCYEAGNYFRTIDQAQKARELLKETLTKFHEEND